jgi:hypothetical protein
VYVPCTAPEHGGELLAGFTSVYQRATEFPRPVRLTLEDEHWSWGLLPRMLTSWGIVVMLAQLERAERWRLRAFTYECDSLLSTRATRVLKDYKRAAPPGAPVAAPANVFLRDGFTGAAGVPPPPAEDVYVGGILDPFPEGDGDSETSSGSDGAFMSKYELAQEFLELRASGCDLKAMKARSRSAAAGNSGKLVSLTRAGEICRDTHGRPLSQIREELLRTVLGDRYR